MPEPTSTQKRTGWRARIQDGGDLLLDRYLGIETTGLVSNEELGFSTDVGNPYQASNWVNLLVVRRLFREMRVSERDVFIDVGCGRGQVLALAARYPFARVIGLDLSAPMLAVAAQNMERLATRRHCGAVELVNENALDYIVPDDVTLVYLYMPVPTHVYEVLVGRLAESAARKPRPVRIIYLQEGPEDSAVPPRHGFRQVQRTRRIAVYALGDDVLGEAVAPSRLGSIGAAARRPWNTLRSAAGRRRRDLVKRGFDLAVASTALVMLLPLILGVALATRRKLGRPVLFRHERPGLHGRPFTLLKFRTMTDARDAGGELLDDGERLLPFGRRLRALSLDELPELWNVLRGDMSIVGPRPLLVRYLGRYTTEQMRRHEVRPGITGLAQVSGRNALTWDEKFALDLEYVDRHDLRMDLRIIWRTLKVVLNREGIEHQGDVTMPEYLGDEAPRSSDPADS